MMLHACWEYNRYGRGLSYRNIKNISNLCFHLQSVSSNTILKLFPICLGFLPFLFLFFDLVVFVNTNRIGGGNGWQVLIDCGRWWVRVKRTNIKLVFVASPLTMQY